MTAVALAVALVLAAEVPSPDPLRTPGALCTPADRDFSGHAYNGAVAICRRHLLLRVKTWVAKVYGLPRAAWPTVEFDHLVPLCAGGSNAAENIWPEPLADARLKDRLEKRVCALLRAGRVTQGEAVVVFRVFAGSPP